MAQVSIATYRSQKVTLHEYVLKAVFGEAYHAIIKQSGGSVDGIVYFSVSSEAFDRLDKFEGPLYMRAEAVVACSDSQRTAHTRTS